MTQGHGHGGVTGRDRIELRGIRVLGVHGLLPQERERAQPFEVDVDLEADLAQAGASDDLGDTVDYGALVSAVARVVGGERCDLLERLAQRLAEELQSDPRVESVTVAVRKLRPPVPVDLASAGVRLTRARPPSARPRRRAFVGLGSNLGDRRRLLREAVAALPGTVAVSPLYETEPLGGPPGQPPYLNLAVELYTHLSPRELLALGQRLEADAGRRRGERFGPRPLDVDLLLVEGVEMDEPDLTLPHPRMGERRFVLAPLADIAPEVVPDGWERNASGRVERVGRL